MFEVDEAARIITETAAPEATIIFGAVIDEAYTGQVKCTVVATGFDVAEMQSTSYAMTPAQRYLTKPQTGRAPEANKEEKADRGAPIASGAPQLNHEELEVPAFMRKPISK